MKKLKFREVNKLVHNHTACKWQIETQIKILEGLFFSEYFEQ